MALPSRAAAKPAGKGKIPFWVRLKAWWEGYDLAIRAKQQVPLDSGVLSQDAVHYEATGPRSMRLEVMQQIWGKGMSGPGDEDYILRLVKPLALRSEEHTSELQSLMRISYAVFCLKKKLQNQTQEN